MKVLLIEDNPSTVETVALCLEMRWEDAIIVSVSEGEKGVEMVETEDPNVVILDLGLPDVDGLTALRKIRSFSDVPVIILSVRGEEQDKVAGLERGADDYVVKPFSPGELLARVQAVLRRAKASSPQDDSVPLTVGDIIIDPGMRRVTVRGREVKLTPTEYDFLYLLARNAGRTLTHEFLLSKVWGEEYTDSPNYLKVYAQRLRNKVEENPKDPQLVLTQRGGYLLARETPLLTL
jgi:two-component system KDP operon response regulator KdpE